MRIPASFQLRYAEHLKLIEEVRNLTEPKLRLLAHDGGWLFDDRLKSEESALAKLQVGKLASLAAMDDFYAAMIVVPTLTGIDPAVNAVTAAFGTADRQQRRPQGPEQFTYDDVHVIVTLGSLGVSLDPSGLIGSTRIEVQIRTGLQWAWWRATHDPIYKGEASWGVRRVASRERAALETHDQTLADPEAASAGIPAPPAGEDETRLETIRSWLDRWPPPLRPEDPRRFAETTSVFLDTAGSDLDQTETLLDGDRGKELVAYQQLTPVQALQVLVIEDGGEDVLEMIRVGERQLLVTEEMIRASAALETLGLDHVVDLDAPITPSGMEPEGSDGS